MMFISNRIMDLKIKCDGPKHKGNDIKTSRFWFLGTHNYDATHTHIYIYNFIERISGCGKQQATTQQQPPTGGGAAVAAAIQNYQPRKSTKNNQEDA